MLDALLQDENLLELKRAKAQSKPKKIAVGSTCPICDNKVIYFGVLKTVQVGLDLCYKSVKVEKILKGSLDSIPSPSMKIQIMGRKVCLSCKGETLLGIVNKLLKTKSLLTSPSNVLPYYLKQTFPPKI